MTTALRIEETVVQTVQSAYEKLRKGYVAKPYPSRAERADWLERLERLLIARREDFVKAADADFSGRCRQETLLADVVVTLETVRSARKQLGRWMRPQEVSPSVYFLPSRAYIEYLLPDYGEQETVQLLRDYTGQLSIRRFPGDGGGLGP